MCKLRYSSQKNGMMAMKVDMEQAYDCMSWDTLQMVMSMMDFSARFIHWVMQCIIRPRFSLLINGNRTPWIYAMSGLRQNTDRISHLLYADDILVFAEANMSNALQIMGILQDYCGWTGQNINREKSAVLFNKKCPGWKKRMIARIMGYRKVSSLEYLGLPLVMKRLVGADFSNDIKRAHEKMNIWGKKHLSLAGRALLIWTSLLTIPMYLMTHTAVPNGVLNSIEKLGGQFLWKKDSNSSGLHYVKWKELCQTKEYGGHGFLGLTTWQGPLRARLAWEVLQDSNSILHKLVRDKYGMELWSHTQIWRPSITWKVIHDRAKALRPIIRWKIGNGHCIDMLHDCWILDRKIALWTTFVNVDEVENVKVSILLNDSLQWKEEEVERYFGKCMAERIMTINTGGGNGIDCAELIHSRMNLTITAMAYRAKYGGTEYQYS
ncbi:uncharacterized protein LOC110107517 [Dendrobium catenatum]|uniref:uncharacterized protein LOC110107517 n=1 Tax=Dendrobium catenatum TaxID=906689 RepID=UPI0009F45633|nr:uncharacterized protein LOC110107517 [Dendrobium catenatum]